MLGKKVMFPGLWLLPLLVFGVVLLAGCGGGGGGGAVGGNGITLVAIEVSPTNPGIALGTTWQFTATGVYSDTTRQDLTASVAWSSSTAAATITAAGLATGASSGTASITASFGGLSGVTTLTVTAATLASIEVTPTNPSIALGTTRQFRAVAIFSDTTKQDITASASWSSSTAAATITAAGLATGASSGTASITASFGGLSGATTLTVTAATLAANEVPPHNPSIALGTTRQFRAVAIFSDTTKQDITASASWSSSTAAATITAAGVATGG